MARINIEETFWLDPRVEKLKEILGNKILAYGQCVYAFRIAQTYWAKKGDNEERRPIPKEVWSNMGVDELLIVGLAVEKDDGIYVKGSEDCFKWVVALQENGKKGGRPKRPQDIEIIESDKTKNNLTEPSLTKAKAKKPILYLNPNLNHLNTNTLVPNTDDFVKVWNDHCGDLPKVIKLGSSRASHAKARLKENPSLDYWIDIIKRAAASDFCNGRNVNGTWKFDFDFLIKPDTQFKVLEGKYDNKQTKTNTPRKILDGDNIV